MTTNEDLLARRDAVVPRGIPRITKATAVRASGARITDVEGRELIDFASGIGVTNAGHCPPSVVEAIRKQAGELLHTCFAVAAYEPYVALCEKLVELFPHGDATKVMLANSGAEAVENAVKIARQATGRPAVICFGDSFHGRTLLCMSLTSKIGYKKGCGPFAPEVYRLNFPNFYRYGDGLSVEAFVRRELDRFEEALHTHVAAQDVAAVLIEPIQGEGGFVPTPEGYLPGLHEICKKHGILLIADEVQSGFCRTGPWAAYEHFGVVPELSTWAKAMGGGLPVSCVIGRADVMDGALPGTIGGTYGGNPVACASALATIELMEKENLGERATAIGKRIRERFAALAKKTPWVGDVRGIGAMMAMELVEEGDKHRPASKLVGDVIASAVERGVLLVSAGVYGNVLRILAPLVIDDADLDHGLTVIEEEVLRHAEAHASGSPAGEASAHTSATHGTHVPPANATEAARR